MPQAPASSLPLVHALRPLLHTSHFGRAVRGYEVVPSTNTLAAEWASHNAPEGSVVVAEYQQDGRGRLGRRWDAAAGQNLMFSVVLRPTLPPDQFGLITLAASLAAAEALDRFVSPLQPVIKWPNDILLDGRKCCGMLLESAWSGSRPSTSPVVILGIGLNVNQAQFPADLGDRATSLLLATGRHVPRAPLFARLLNGLEHHYTLLSTAPETVRTAYEARLHRRGQRVTLRLAHPPASAEPERVEGRLLGISTTGALRLQTDTGIRTFHAGEVTTA